MSSGARSWGGLGVVGTSPGILYSIGMGASPSPHHGFHCGLLGAVSGASPVAVVGGSSEGADGGGALGTMGVHSWLPLLLLILLPHRDPSPPLSDVGGNTGLLWVTCMRRISVSHHALFSYPSQPEGH
jgi:hypothetical protein